MAKNLAVLICHIAPAEILTGKKLGAWNRTQSDKIKPHKFFSSCVHIEPYQNLHHWLLRYVCCRSWLLSLGLHFPCWESTFWDGHFNLKKQTLDSHGCVIASLASVRGECGLQIITEQRSLRYNLCRGGTNAKESLGVGSSDLRDCEAKEDPANFRGKASFKRRMTLVCFLWGKSEECYFFLGSLNFFFSYGYNVCGAEIELSVLRKLRHFLAYIHSKKSTLGFSPLWFLVTGTENVVLNESLEKFR